MFARASDASYYDAAGVLRTASSNEPRFDYDQATKASLGLLLEGPRTNIVTYSSDFSNSVWDGLTNITRTPGSIIGPDGELSGCKLEVTSSAVTNVLRTFSGAASGDNVYSIFAKKGSGAEDLNRFALRNGTTATNLVFIDFNYDTGVISYSVGSSGASAQDVGDGWWRIELTSDQFTLGDDVWVYFGASGSPETAGEFNYVYGPQFEAGSFASSYIPTTSSTATRAADSLTFSTSPWFGAANSILLKGRTPPGVDTEHILFSVDDGTADERIRVTKQSDGHVHVIVTAGGVTQADLGMGAVGIDTDFALMCRIAANDFAASLNGGAIVSDTSGSMPSGITTARIGSGLTAGQEWFSTCAVGGGLWPSGISNSELQRLAVV